jgi:hypothetical protein
MLEVLYQKELKRSPEGSGVRRSSKPKPSKGKKKTAELVITPVVTEKEDSSPSSAVPASEESGGTSSSERPSRNKRMDDFQSQLDALKLKKDSAELGVARPYPIEWDSVPYPPKFKPMSLIQFDGKGSPTQHIYYFLSQT